MTSKNIQKIIIHVCATFLLFYSSVSFAGQFKVVRVYDGDTIKAVGHDIEIKVRLVGIDSPVKGDVIKGDGAK